MTALRSAAALSTSLLAGAVVGMVAGCGGGSGAGEASARTVTVLAAASLTEVFERIGGGFQSANPGTRVTFSFAASSSLAQQVIEGAPADVFAAASPETMRRVTDAGLADGRPTGIAHNRLVIAVPRGNPRRIASLADLARPTLKVARCADQVPCGAAARTVLAAAAVALRPATLERDVKATLSKLRLGEVDAALVYRTDARAAHPDVDTVEFPEAQQALNEYQIVALASAADRTAAARFVTYVRSQPAREVLADAGFEQP